MCDKVINNRQVLGYLIISVRIEVNFLARICLFLEAKFSGNLKPIMSFTVAFIIENRDELLTQLLILLIKGSSFSIIFLNVQLFALFPVNFCITSKKIGKYRTNMNLLNELMNYTG